MKRFFLLFFVCLLATWSHIAAAPDAVSKVADSFVAAYNADEPARISAQLNAPMRAALSSEQFAQFLSDTKKQYGKILRLEAPRKLAPTASSFQAIFERGRLTLLVALDEKGQIAGLRLSAPTPQNPPKIVATRGKTALSLPFRGQWLVFWGGDTVEQNYHRNVPNQRFAFDILKVDAAAKTHRGDGSKNEDYFAFGEPILAPAAGVVADVVSGIRDNVPGQMNPMVATGNTVVIRHPSGEYSLLAHLKQGSTKVKVGDRVTAGQMIGLCGNSGNSSEAHLHFQLQKTARFSDEGSLKAFFGQITVRRAGKSMSKANYSPVKGDLVSGEGRSEARTLQPSFSTQAQTKSPAKSRRAFSRLKLVT
ncbi:MAG TPA: peptidoglycan DD-metalloendopeptidase family protein [Abditibacterium sp.]|jgi:murein DD-endopeptidase MepM/ murein hydrolase activator NlpD